MKFISSSQGRVGRSRAARVRSSFWGLGGLVALLLVAAPGAWADDGEESAAEAVAEEVQEAPEIPVAEVPPENTDSDPNKRDPAGVANSGAGVANAGAGEEGEAPHEGEGVPPPEPIPVLRVK